jgi:general secretion pathway protein D
VLLSLNTVHRPFARLALVCAAFLLASCQAPVLPEIQGPLRAPGGGSAGQTEQVLAGQEREQRTALRVSRTPAPPRAETSAASAETENRPRFAGDPISVSLDSLPLPAFVNAAFGELLKTGFEIDSEVAQRNQIVTLRTAEPVTPEQFYNLVVNVLANYGVAVRFQGGIFRIAGQQASGPEAPRIIRTRALPNVPGSQRPIFQYLSLESIDAQTAQRWVIAAFGQSVTLFSDQPNNAVLILGQPDNVAAAVEAIRVLDQPRLAGSQGVRIEPAFWSAKNLADKLVEILSVQGYATSTNPQAPGAITLIPVEPLNVILVFSLDPANLEQVLQWARELDQPSQTVERRGLFYYQVQNTAASDLAEVLNQVFSDSAVSMTSPGDRRPEAAQQMQGAAGAQSQAAQGGAPVQVTVTASGGRLVVDEVRNAIIFQGSAEEYAQLRPLLQTMDRAPFEVLIEATIAEVTYTDTEDLGIEWFVSDLGIGDYFISGGTLGNLGLGGGSSVFRLRNQGGAQRAVLNALSRDQRVSILSNPRIVTQSGTEARFQVGTEVPIITTQQTNPQQQIGGTSGLLQSVQYRNTGVIMNVTPVVHSNNRVDLEISQEVSEAQENTTSSITSPIILNRSLATTLSLEDGSTVLLGGLISQNNSFGNVGVPLLKDIPVIGQLFSNRTQTARKTELIVLITPYIIKNSQDAAQIREAFRSRLGTWAQQPALMPTP